MVVKGRRRNGRVQQIKERTKLSLHVSWQLKKHVLAEVHFLVCISGLKKPLLHLISSGVVAAWDVISQAIVTVTFQVTDLSSPFDGNEADRIWRSCSSDDAKMMMILKNVHFCACTLQVTRAKC